MRLLKAEYSSGHKIFIYLCDECMVESEFHSPQKGMWFLDCGHHLCSSCYDYGLRHNKKPHTDRCPKWKIGSFPQDSEEKQTKIQQDLERRGYRLNHVQSPGEVRIIR